MRLPPDFADNIQLTHLTRKSWALILPNMLVFYLMGAGFISFSILMGKIQFFGIIFSHFMIFGLINVLNNYRIDDDFKILDYFWSFLSLKNFMVSIVSTFLSIPFFVFIGLIGYLLTVSDFPIFILIMCLTLPFLIYVFLFSIVYTFVAILEEKRAIETFKRARMIISGHFKDLIFLTLFLSLITILGSISLILIPLIPIISILVFTDFIRYLIRQYELSSI